MKSRRHNLSGNMGEYQRPGGRLKGAQPQWRGHDIEYHDSGNDPGSRNCANDAEAKRYRDAAFKPLPTLAVKALLQRRLWTAETGR